MIKYLVQMAAPNSSTWAAHLRTLCLKYNLPHPLQLLDNNYIWEKSKWKTFTKTNITAFYEKELRKQALENSKMKYLNVQVLGLSGNPHPSLNNINTKQDVRKL